MEKRSGSKNHDVNGITLSTFKTCVKNIPLDLDSLSKNSLDYLTDWQIISKENYGIAYRFGTKSIKDKKNKRNSVEFQLHFTCPFGIRGYNVTDEDMEEMQALVERVMSTSTELFSRMAKNKKASIISIQVHPPKHMIDELSKVLRRN